MRKTLLATSMLLLAGQAQAADTYTFDKSHTNIMWFASHLGFSDSMGQFMDYDGKLVLDEDKPENSSVEVTIKTASVMTGIEKFDDHLRSPDFFDSAKYPDAVFKSTKVELTGEKSAKVEGELTMLGKTKPLTLDVTLNKIGENPFAEKTVAGFSATATIYRSHYGINYALPAVPDEVDIRIETEFFKEE